MSGHPDRPADLTITEDFDGSPQRPDQPCGLHRLGSSLVSLDALEVAVDELPYAAPVTEQIDQFRRIQERLPLFIQGRMTRAEVDALTAGLSPRGLGIRASSWVRDGRRF